MAAVGSAAATTTTTTISADESGSRKNNGQQQQSQLSSSMIQSSSSLPNLTSDSKCEYHHVGGDSITFRLGLSHDSHVLFEPTNFSLVRGTVTGLVGVNGSGKTSLCRIIASSASAGSTDNNNGIPNFPSDLIIQYISSHEEINHYNDNESNNDDDNQNNNIDRLTPEEYINLAVQQKISIIQNEIDQLEESMMMENNDNENDNDIEEIANKLSELYDEQDEMIESCSKLIQHMLVDELGFGPHNYLHKPIKDFKLWMEIQMSFISKSIYNQTRYTHC